MCSRTGTPPLKYNCLDISSTINQPLLLCIILIVQSSVAKKITQATMYRRLSGCSELCTENNNRINIVFSVLLLFYWLLAEASPHFEGLKPSFKTLCLYSYPILMTSQSSQFNADRIIEIFVNMHSHRTTIHQFKNVIFFQGYEVPLCGRRWS